MSSGLKHFRALTKYQSPTTTKAQLKVPANQGWFSNSHKNTFTNTSILRTKMRIKMLQSNKLKAFKTQTRYRQRNTQIKPKSNYWLKRPCRRITHRKVCFRCAWTTISQGCYRSQSTLRYRRIKMIKAFSLCRYWTSHKRAMIWKTTIC